MPLSYNKLIWTGNRRDDFIVKSAYNIACSTVEAEETGESSSGNPRTLLWKKIWHLKIPSKIRIFAWRACMNGLPTRLNLSRRGVNVSPICPICGQEMETTTHVLIQCELAKRVWDRWQGRPMNRRGSQLLEITDAALKILEEGADQDLEIFFVTSWAIWYNKNQKVFENVCNSAAQIWCSANTIRWDFKETVGLCLQSQNNEASRWEAPPSGMFKINVDGAISIGGRPSSVGVMIRDSKGNPVAALSKVLQGQYSSLESEIVALENGILLAKEMALSQVIFESDALTLVQDINTSESTGNLGHLYQGILDLLKSFKSWKICHLKSEHNRVAHELAHYAKCSGATQVWKGCTPPMIQHLNHLECT